MRIRLKAQRCPIALRRRDGPPAPHCRTCGVNLSGGMCLNRICREFGISKRNAS